MPMIDALLPEFDMEMANTRKVLERVPEDKLGWRPHPKSFTMGALATHLAMVPGWMVVLIIGREFIVLGLRNIASAEGFTIQASALGKTKMVLQVLAVCALILGAKHRVFKPLGLLLLWLVVVSAVASAVQYFLRFWSQVDDSVKQRRRLRLLERRKKQQDVATL